MAEDDSRIQDLVDALAARLHRSVAVDDPNIRLVAASRHFGDEDAVRIQSILGRQVDEELERRVLAMGIRQLTTARKIDLEEEGVKPRVCVPVRCSGKLMGFLWLIDDGALSGGQIGEATEVADRIGVRLYHREVALERRRARQEILLRGLLSSEPGTRADTLRGLRDEDLLGHSPHLTVAVISSPRRGDDPATPSEALLTRAADRLLKSQPEDGALAWVGRTRLVILFQGRDSRSCGAERQLRSALVDLRTASARRWTAGLGNADGGLQEAHRAYERALIAVRAAEHLPEFGDVVMWENIGVYGTLATLAPHDLSLSAYPAALTALARQRNGSTMLQTAETFLDLAGNVHNTAAALHIHRGTLYQRLSRIEQLSGLDLSNGVDRLTLHLGIKLARLAGTYEQLVTSADTHP